MVMLAMARARARMMVQHLIVNAVLFCCSDSDGVRFGQVFALALAVDGLAVGQAYNCTVEFAFVGFKSVTRSVVVTTSAVGGHCSSGGYSLVEEL